jgi:hypothetical protein
MQWWQKVCDELEGAIGDLQTAQTDITNQLALIQSSFREIARITSYPDPGSILTATDAGTSATITLATHSRVYPVHGSISIPNVTFTNLPHSFTGLSYSTKYYIYYDDTTLANTAPTFVTTTSADTAQVGAAAGRHFVGFITTPASGGGSTTGTGGGTPGGGGGGGGNGGWIP